MQMSLTYFLFQLLIFCGCMHIERLGKGSMVMNFLGGKADKKKGTGRTDEKSPLSENRSTGVLFTLQRVPLEVFS